MNNRSIVFVLVLVMGLLVATRPRSSEPFTKSSLISEEEFLFRQEQEESVFAETDQYGSFTPEQRAFLLDFQEFLQVLEEVRQLEQELLRYRGGLDPETCGEADRTACLIYL
ncbi:MAG: hypothetical protein Q7R64_01580 [bacterium]|nr:hypothetical protein [bacterium]